MKKQVCICLLAYFGSWTRTSRLLSSIPGLANNVFAQRSLNSAFVILCRGNCSICLFSSTALTASTLVAVTLVARNYGEGNNTLAALTLVTVTVPTTVFFTLASLTLTAAGHFCWLASTPIFVSSFSNGGLFSIFVQDITQSESASKKLLKTFYRLTVLITQRKPITPPDDFKRNPAGVVPPLCDITGDLEEVTNAVWVRAVDAAINALLATQDRYCRTIVKFTAHSLSLPFYSLGMRTPHNLPPTWAPDKNGSGCSNLKEGVNISGKPCIWAAQPLQLPICISWELVPQPWKSDLCIFCIARICFYLLRPIFAKWVPSLIVKASKFTR